MTLQQQILAEFKQHFPRRTFREIEDLTGIQLTRVFRLMNGAPMRLDEYETLKHVIETRSPFFKSTDRGDKLLARVRAELSHEEIEKIFGQMEKRLHWNQLLSGKTTTPQTDIHIA